MPLLFAIISYSFLVIAILFAAISYTILRKEKKITFLKNSLYLQKWVYIGMDGFFVLFF